MITTHHVPGTPCWLDLGAPDVERAADFYRSVFGWEAESPASEDYVLFRLHGKVVAAIGKLTEQGARSAWMVYFNTPDADATTAAVQRLGGTVRIQPVEPMAGGGKMAQVSDPQGAQFAIFEAGADRAAARLAADSEYRGETWRVPAEEITGLAAGQVIIEVTRDESTTGDDDATWRVHVAAEYPLVGVTSIRRSRTFTIASQSIPEEE